MASEPPVTSGGGMIARIQGILLKPRDEFTVIAAEPMTQQGIMTKWVAPLAAIGPVAGAIGLLVFGLPTLFGVTVHAGPSYVISTALAGWVTSVLCTFLMALVIDALAPSFGGVKDPVAALKLAAFASTAAFVAGIFRIVPTLSFLTLLGFYSLYLFYVGLPILMKVPQDKAIVYLVVIVVCFIVLAVVAGMVVGAVTAAFMPAMPSITLTP